MVCSQYLIKCLINSKKPSLITKYYVIKSKETLEKPSIVERDWPEAIKAVISAAVLTATQYFFSEAGQKQFESFFIKKIFKGEIILTYISFMI